MDVCIFLLCLCVCSNACKLTAAECLDAALLSQKNSPQTLVFLCDGQSWCGGIGDRLRGIMTTFYMSIALERKFKIWMQPVPFSEIFDGPQYDWQLSAKPACDVVVSEMDYGNGTHLMNVLLGGAFFWQRTVCVRTNHFFDADLVRRFPRIFGSAQDVADAHFVYFGEAFRFLFRPNQQTLAVFDNLRRSAGLPHVVFGTKSRDWTAIHFRHGIGTDPERDSLALAPNVSLCHANLRRAMRWQGPVYIASDSYAAKKVLSEHVSDAVFANFTPQHIDLDADITGHLHAWGEFLLLAHASCIVASSSGYSYWASALTAGFDEKHCFVHWRNCAGGQHGPVFSDRLFAANANYTLLASPAFQVNTWLSLSGLERRYMTHMWVLYRGASIAIDAWSVKQRAAELIAQFESLGVHIVIDGWSIILELCGLGLTFTTGHIAEGAANINYINLGLRVPGCHDALSGLIGQTYKCKYAVENFDWSVEVIEKFLIESGDAENNIYSPAAHC